MNRWNAHLKKLDDKMNRLTRENEQLKHSAEFYQKAYCRAADAYDRLLTMKDPEVVEAHLDAEGYKR